MNEEILKDGKFCAAFAKNRVMVHSIYFNHHCAPGRLCYWIFEHIGNLIWSHCQFVTIDYDQIREMLPKNAKNMGRDFGDSEHLLENWVEV